MRNRTYDVENEDDDQIENGGGDGREETGIAVDHLVVDGVEDGQHAHPIGDHTHHEH